MSSEEKIKAFIPELDIDLSHFVDLVSDRFHDFSYDIRNPDPERKTETDTQFLWDQAQLAAIDKCHLIIRGVLRDMLDGIEE